MNTKQSKGESETLSVDSSAKKQLEQQAFNKIGALNAMGVQGERFVGVLFKPFFAAFNNDSRNWDDDATQAVSKQKLIRARVLLYFIALTILLLIIWAAFAEVDEVTRGEGKIIPSRQLQIVQSMDGGVIEKVFVEEGATVSKGDLLVRIDPTRFVASYQEGNVKAFALRAKVQRLKAQIEGKELIPKFDEAVLDEQKQVIRQEQNYYRASLKELKERLTVLRDQIAQRAQELSETKAGLQAAEQAYQMSTKELEATKPLLRSGAVSEIDILRLERDQSAANGERLQAAARARQVRASIQEAESKLLEVGTTVRNQWRAELSEASTQLNSLSRSVEGLADRVKLSELHSPVNGTVQRILLNTIGGIVQPGNAIVEIVPSDDRLLIEAKISPKDIAFLRPGLPATIKLHAYDFSVYGGISATLQHISADTITDERENTFYLVRAITTEKDSAQHLSVIPGMTAQLDILTGKKTILSYLLKPLLRAKANALSER
jgi:adhesin transport system membrane fusion protein